MILVRQIATIRMGLSIICFKVSQVDFHNKYVLQSLKIAFIIANSAYPDEMQITKLPFEGFPVYKGFIPHYQMYSIKLFPWGQKTLSGLANGSVKC